MAGNLTCRQVEEFLMDYLENRLGFWMTLQFSIHLFMCTRDDDEATNDDDGVPRRLSS